jgi:hypothetical protein
VPATARNAKAIAPAIDGLAVRGRLIVVGVDARLHMTDQIRFHPPLAWKSMYVEFTSEDLHGKIAF